MAGPKLTNLQTLISAGINPRTGLPIKAGSGISGPKDQLRMFIRVVDEQDAVNRYKWYNLPGNITGQELERMIYYRGQLAFFFIEELDEFYFMPYALDGTLDFYGRFNSIHPVPFANGTTDDKDVKRQADYLSGLRKKCVYTLKLPNDVTYDDFIHSAVLIHDYTKQLSENIIPRQVLNDPLVNMQSETLSYMRTALINGTGIKGVRVNDADQAQSVREGAESLIKSALEGIPYVPMVGNLDFQELTDGQVLKAEEYLLATQSLDNLRLSGLGIDNGGLFQKKAHILQSESDMASPNVSLIFNDGLAIRQNFCNIVNSIWNLGIWVEPSESVLQVDQDLDGKAYDSNDAGEHSPVEQGDNNEKNQSV
jgi:hypothetical protein